MSGPYAARVWRRRTTPAPCIDMKKYIFIRHARPDIPLGERRCLGRTDVPLGALGRMQACLLGETVHFDTVYCSPLKRAAETAAFLADQVITVPGLEEAYCGEWDGLDFVEIQRKWPELYKLRGNDFSIPMPGCESIEDAVKRFRAALETIPEGSAVVAHNTVIAGFLRKDAGFRFPYASIIEGDTAVSVPHPEMTPALARRLREASGLLPKIQRHCDAVAEEALRLSAGLGLDDNLIECAAILHDIARLEKRHEAVGGEYLDLLGYPEIGEIIRRHGTVDDANEVNESLIVFLADKYMSNTERVSIDERYDRTAWKCTTPEAMERHERSRAAAHAAENALKKARGMQ